MNSEPCAEPSRSGFTLVETLTVTVLLAVLAVLAVPSFVAWRVRDQVDARARTFAATLAYARSEALRRGTRVTVCRIGAARVCLAAGQQCDSGAVDWSCGWAVSVERDGAPTVLRAHPGLAAVSIAGVATSLTFTPPAGQLIGTFRSFDIGPKTPSQATQGARWRRCIRIAAGGRARTTEGACGASS